MRCTTAPRSSDAEFAALSAHFDEAKILEIILLCGFYRTVSYLANGCPGGMGRFPPVVIRDARGEPESSRADWSGLASESE